MMEVWKFQQFVFLRFVLLYLQDFFPDRCQHLNGLNLADLNLIEGDEADNDNIDIIIGCDYYFDVVNNDIARGEGRSGPVAIGSKFGWILSDPTTGADVPDEFSIVHLIVEPNEQLVIQSRYSSNNDNLIGTLRILGYGIGIVDRDVDSVKENTFLREVSFDKQDCRYQVRLPWKAESLPLIPAASMVN